MKTFKMHSLGCKVNSYECASLASLLFAKGYKEDNNNPDVVIINTCSVTSTADQKSRQHIRKFIKAHPNAVSVVMGCYAQGNYEFISKEIGASIVVGTSYRKQIPDLLDEYDRTHKQIVMVDNNPRSFDYEEMGVTSYTENTRAYLKIQDGCNNFCTYCVIPYRRGKMRSRDPKNVISEAEYLVKQGYKEIILVGIHVGGYGKDLEGITFSDLVESLLNIDGLRSLRISSIEESEIDDKLIDLLCTRDNLAKHLHIPLQSGSSTVLRRMNRKYDAPTFINKLKRIRSLFPDVMLSTDVITGFPGESEEEFKETYNTILECGFNQLHVFPYSERGGTLASRMPNQINPQVKNARAHTLIELSKELWDKYVDRFIDKELEFLVEKIEDGVLYARSSNYIEVAVPSLEGNTGDIIKIKVNKSTIQSR